MNQLDFNFQQVFSLDKDNQFFALPEQVSSDFQGKSGQIKIEEKLLKMPADLQQVSKENILALSKYLKIWDIKVVRGLYETYYFNLPPSYFTSSCQIFANRQRELQEEFNQVQDLSSAQVSQIFQTGTFELPSQQFQIPYVWQLSSFIIKGLSNDILGRKNINKSYFDDIGLGYHIFKHSPQFLYNEDDNSGNPCTIRSGIYNIFCKFSVYLSIMIGFRETYNEVDFVRLKNQIEYQRQINLLQAKCFNESIYQHLYFQTVDQTTYVNENAQKKKNLLMQTSTEFNQDYEKIKLQMQNQYDTLVEQWGQDQRFEDQDEKQEFLENLKNQAMQQEKDFLQIYGIQVSVEESLNTQIINAQIKAQKLYWEKKVDQTINLQLINHINQLNECIRAQKHYEELFKEELNKKEIEFEKQLIENNFIKSKSYIFIDEEKKKFRKLSKAHLKEKYRILLLEDLKKQNIKDVDVYMNYLQNSKQMKEELKILVEEQQQRNKRPNITLQTTRKCFPPYNVIKSGDYYYLEREKSYHITSNCPLWKIQILIMRYFTWTANVMFWLFANGISGPLGIKALFYCQVFHPDVTINQRTGQIIPTHFTVTPVVVHMSNVCQGMKQSRVAFENQPDTGFFGKNCARLCNLIEVYIFRFLIVGVIGVLVIIPTLIILNFALSISLALTAWLWIVIILIVMYIFKILIYDFDVVERNTQNIISSPVFFPLIVNTYQFFIKGVLSLFFNLVVIFFIIPLSSCVVIIFGHIRYILRTLYDCLMILFIKCLGRVPASENSLAWKISGPGISRKYYFTIKNEEALILVAAELERCIIQEYEKRMDRMITAPSEQVQQTLQAFFSMFNASYNFSDDGNHSLKKNLRDQISMRLSLLPRLPSEIRFTAYEIETLKMLTKQFLKNQIIIKDMKNYIWTTYGVQKGDYNQLTAEILKKIFGGQILQPLEDLDLRFHLIVNENYDFSKKIEKALEGQVNLNKPVNYVIKPLAAKEDNEKPKLFSFYSEIIESIWSCQSLQQNWSSLNDKHKRFYVNYCLKNN